MDIDLKQLRELLRALKQFDVTGFSMEQAGVRLEIQRGSVTTRTTVPAPTASPEAGGGPSPLPSMASGAEDGPDIVYVTSPFVGTFYRAPDPNTAPFVEAGHNVRAGQVLCIVEAMKLMNEIEADVDCTILEVLVETGKSVEYGDRLFKVRKR